MKVSENLKKILILITLGFLTTSAFFIRLENFIKSSNRSIDEIVYYRMALQMTEDLSDYNTIPYGQELAATGRPLPKYFFEPLFKHPPLFTLLVTASLKIFGKNSLSAEYVSLLFGVLLIPLTYLIATLLFSRPVAFLSAFFVWMDPVLIITSQKVWMDTTLAFFWVLAIYIYLLGVQKCRPFLFLIAGIAGGLAVLTRYPGILSIIIISLHAVVQHRHLFRDRVFLMSLAMPFLMLIPWGWWNFKVHGMTFFYQQLELHNLGLTSRTMMLLGLVVIIGIFFVKMLKSHEQKISLVPSPLSSGKEDIIRQRLVTLCGVLFLVGLHQHIFRSLDPGSFPVTSWYQGLFYSASPLFYFGRLMEFSFLYFFAFAAFFISVKRHTEEKTILFLGSLVTIIFFMVWKSYQSRYVLSAIPFLIILAVQFLWDTYQLSNESKSWAVQLIRKIILPLALLSIIFKTNLINLLISYPNNLCYY